MRWLVLIVAPAVDWLLHHMYKDRCRREPLTALLATYSGGVIAGIVCLRLFEVLNAIGWEAGPEDDVLPFLAYCLLGVGLLERLRLSRRASGAGRPSGDRGDHPPRLDLADACDP